jgi:protein-tyrosine phosphatase
VIPSVPNLRDLGGHQTRSGAAVRSGLVYRADQLNPVTPDDLVTLSSLGLELVVDLRTPEETRARPDQVPPGVTVRSFDVLADAQMSGLADLESLLRDPERANAALGGGRVDQTFEDVYRGFVSLPSARRAYRELFLCLGRREDLPLLFHCATGKDRTGWAAAAFLTLLGVAAETVVEDYLRSNEVILSRYAPMIDAFAARGGQRDILTAVFGVRRRHLDAAFGEMARQFGTIERYFAEGLGLDEAVQGSLRELYLEEPAHPVATEAVSR